MPADLPGPEKPIEWATMLLAEQSKPTAARPMYTPERVRPRHRIAVMLHEAGMKAQDIAKALGYTQARVSVILNSHNPHLQQVRAKFATQVADNIQDIQTRLQLYAGEMLTRTVDIARQDKDIAQARLAARDILFMAGFTPVKKQMNLNANVPMEELRGVVSKIQEANDAAAKFSAFEVRNPQLDKASAA